MGRFICLFIYNCCMENKALRNLSAVIALFLVGVYFIKQICRVDSVFAKFYIVLVVPCYRPAKDLVLQTLGM